MSNTKNICFLVSENKTLLFYEVYKYLKKFEINVFWITPNNRWHNYLVKKGVKDENILNLERNFSKNKNKKKYHLDLNHSKNNENKFGISYSKIIHMDRILKSIKPNISYSYINICFEKIYVIYWIYLVGIN